VTSASALVRETETPDVDTVAITFRWERWKVAALEAYVLELQARGWTVTRSSMCAQALDELMARREWMGGPALVAGGGEAKDRARQGKSPTGP
jgi:hypothetical protein